MDYFAQNIHNCFHGNTKFYTSDGLKKFSSFKDGETVYVNDKDGNIRKATVHMYGKQPMQKVTLYDSRNKEYEVICTKNHRWILSDGTVTTDLKVGDTIYNLTKKEFPIVETEEDAKYFAFGFILGDGVDRKNNNTSEVVLCGKKIEYSYIFEKAGFRKYNINDDDKCCYLYPNAAIKQDILNSRAWRFLNIRQKQMLFYGYYSADGSKDNTNRLSTSDIRMCDFIESCAHLIGLYVYSKNKLIHDTQYKKDAILYNYRFVRYVRYNNPWKVVSIKNYRNGELFNAYCVEEPETHSFLLEYGIPTGNCCLVNLGDMLQNGTVISGTKIEKPHSFATACNIATQIMASVASNQYGGQSENLSDLVPFVDISRQNIRKKMLKETESIKDKFTNEEEYLEYVTKITEDLLKDEIKKGVQTIQYQILTLMTTNGQTPFVTVFMYLGAIPEGPMRDDFAMVIEEVVKQRIKGIQNERGAWITPAFPKLVYVLEPDNITEDSKYWYLTKLCAACSAKRLVPDYVSEKKMLEYKKGVDGEGHVYAPMGCRSFLTVWNPVVNGNEKIELLIDDKGYYTTPQEIWNDNALKSVIFEEKDNKLYPKNPLYLIRPYAGRKDKFKVVYFFKTEEGETKIQCASDIFSARFNQGVVTVNLPYIALESGKDENKFWEIFEERMRLVHKALQFRHQRLKGTPSDVSPIHWQNGALARLDKGQVIDPLLYGGYSTISVGYAGLFECVYYMTGHSHTDDGIGKEFAMKVMNYLNDCAKKWKAEENIDYSVYGTPIESTTEKFARALSRDFGVIPEVSDHDYVTNSYHVSVREHIDPFKKLKLEGEFQRLSPGGCISYIETSNLTNNVNAVLEVMKYIYDNTMYAELNTKSDYCQICGYDGEIQIETDKKTGLLYWKCPNCGNTDQKRMNVARRTCGYIGTQFFCQGRTQEIKERYVHLGGND